jgi:hypothetical protein
LEPFEELTDLLSSEKMVTVSSVAPMLNHVKKLCMPLPGEDVEDEKMVELRAKIWDYIIARY